MSTTVFYSLSTAVFYSLSVTQLYPLLVLFHCVHCCFLESVLCPSVPHNVSTVCMLCVTMSTTAFYSLSTVWQYLILYCRYVVSHRVHCCLLQSVHCLSELHTVTSVASVSLYPLLSSRFYPISVSTSHVHMLVLCHSVHCCLLQSVHCLSVPNTVRMLVLCHSVHCCLLRSVHSLSIPHTVPSASSVSLCPMLSSIVWP